MSENFIGRGRGWLNLHKNKTKSALGIPPQPTIPVESSSKCVNEDDIFVDAPGYEFLVNGVRQLNIDDDGIKFNQEIRNLLEKWKEGCPTSDKVERSFQAIYQSSLYDGELASKLVYLMTSSTFISQEVRGKNIRLLFLSQLQRNYGSGSLYKTNPVPFRNCTRMLGEFFNKARSVNGDPFSFLAVPLIGNLQILLNIAYPQDLQLLATQLFMNGFALRAECPEQFTKLLNDARLMLISKELTKKSKLWLLLSIEGADTKFGIFSSDLYTFYQVQMGEAATAIIQRTPSILSVNTNQSNKLLDQSDVNVLQVCNLIHSSTDKSWQFSTTDSNTSTTSQGHTSGFVSDSSSTSYGSSRISRKPVLGVEFRLDRYNIDTGTSPTWRETRSGWDGRPKRGREDRGNVNVFQVSSTDTPSQFCTSNCSQGNPSGFVSDSSSLGSSKNCRNSRISRMPILSVGAMLSRYNIVTKAS